MFLYWGKQGSVNSCKAYKLVYLLFISMLVPPLPVHPQILKEWKFHLNCPLNILDQVNLTQEDPKTKKLE